MPASAAARAWNVVRPTASARASNVSRMSATTALPMGARAASWGSQLMINFGPLCQNCAGLILMIAKHRRADDEDDIMAIEQAGERGDPGGKDAAKTGVCGRKRATGR